MAFTAALAAREAFEVRCLHHLHAAHVKGHLRLQLRVALLVMRRVLPEREFPGAYGVSHAWSCLALDRLMYVLHRLLTIVMPYGESVASNEGVAHLHALLSAILGASVPPEWLIKAAGVHVNCERQFAWLNALVFTSTDEDDCSAMAHVPLMLPPTRLQRSVALPRPFAYCAATLYVRNLGVSAVMALRFTHHGTVAELHTAIAEAAGTACDAESPRRLGYETGGAASAAMVLDAVHAAVCTTMHAGAPCPCVRPVFNVDLVITDTLLPCTVWHGLEEPE